VPPTWEISAATRVVTRAVAIVLVDIASATETGASNPLQLFGAPKLLALLTLLCCYLTARESTRIDPAITLRMG